MSRQKQWLFAILVSSLQLVLMLLVILWLFAQYGDTANLVIRRQISTSNHALVAQSALQIQSMHLSDIQPGSRDRERLQSLVETTKIPNHGFLAVIDAETGTYLCHPSAKENPEINQQTWDSSIEPSFDLSGQATPSTSALHDPEVSLVLNTKSGIDIVNGCYLEELDVIVLVCQRYSFAMAVNAILTQPLSKVGLP